MVESMLSLASGKVFEAVLCCFGGSKEVTLSPMGRRRLAARRSTMIVVVAVYAAIILNSVAYCLLMSCCYG